MKMRIFVCVCAFLFFVAGLSVSAQKTAPRDPMNTGTWMINFGIGPGIHYYSGYSAGFGPGFQASFERGMWQLGPGVLTLGAEAGVSYFSYKSNGYYYKNKYYDETAYRYSWVSLIMAARSAYHYGWKVKGLDIYGGLSTGIRILSFSKKYYGYYADVPDVSYNPGSFNLFLGTFVGASYFFNNTVGINAELGYNINYAQIGMVFKLN
jgi:hypothetical protein